MMIQYRMHDGMVCLGGARRSTYCTGASGSLGQVGLQVQQLAWQGVRESSHEEQQETQHTA